MEDKFIIHPLDPIFDEESKVLILGSFPSVKSREMSFYYANPTNRFWKVMADIFHEDILNREEFCHRHHIAVWDVIHSCAIHGSSDSSIKNVTVNDIDGLLRKTDIQVIFTTGKKASQLFEKYVNVSCKHIALPSTSSANAQMRLETLEKEYSVIYEYVKEN